MADHVRRQIINAVKARLTGLATTQNNVFLSRLRVLSASELPALLIYATEEEANYDEGAGSLTIGPMRELTLSVECRVKDSTEDEAIIDEIAKEVEQAMHVDSKFGGLVANTSYISTSTEVNGEEEDNLVFSASINFLLRYRVATGAPDVVKH